MRTELKRLLALCTPAQVDVFNRMYGSVENIPKDKMELAIKQCESTVVKNQKKCTNVECYLNCSTACTGDCSPDKAHRIGQNE
jgi:hypothetical protein